MLGLQPRNTIPGCVYMHAWSCCCVWVCANTHMQILTAVYMETQKETIYSRDGVYASVTCLAYNVAAEMKTLVFMIMYFVVLINESSIQTFHLIF